MTFCEYEVPRQYRISSRSLNTSCFKQSKATPWRYKEGVRASVVSNPRLEYHLGNKPHTHIHAKKKMWNYKHRLQTSFFCMLKWTYIFLDMSLSVSFFTEGIVPLSIGNHQTLSFLCLIFDVELNHARTTFDPLKIILWKTPRPKQNKENEQTKGGRERTKNND